MKHILLKCNIFCKQRWLEHLFISISLQNKQHSTCDWFHAPRRRESSINSLLCFRRLSFDSSSILQKSPARRAPRCDRMYCGDCENDFDSHWVLNGLYKDQLYLDRTDPIHFIFWIYKFLILRPKWLTLLKCRMPPAPEFRIDVT